MCHAVGQSLIVHRERFRGICRDNISEDKCEEDYATTCRLEIHSTNDSAAIFHKHNVPFTAKKKTSVACRVCQSRLLSGNLGKRVINRITY